MLEIIIPIRTVSTNLEETYTSCPLLYDEPCVRKSVSPGRAWCKFGVIMNRYELKLTFPHNFFCGEHPTGEEVLQ